MQSYVELTLIYVSLQQFDVTAYLQASVFCGDEQCVSGLYADSFAIVGGDCYFAFQHY